MLRAAPVGANLASGYGTQGLPGLLVLVRSLARHDSALACAELRPGRPVRRLDLLDNQDRRLVRVIVTLADDHQRSPAHVHR